MDPLPNLDPNRMENMMEKNGHEADLEMSFRHIDDTNLHKKNAANPARIAV